MKSYVPARLVTTSEPTVADRAIIGDEFYAYQKDRRLEYIGIPDLLNMVDEHEAATTLMMGGLLLLGHIGLSAVALGRQWRKPCYSIL